MTARGRFAFATRALERVRQARPGHVCELDERAFAILVRGPDGHPQVIGLSNFFAEWEHAAGANEDAVFDRIERTARIVDGKETLDEIRVCLMPRIRPRRFFDVDAPSLTPSDSPAFGKKTQYEALAEHLGVAVAIDRPEHIEYVLDASEYGVSFDELRAIALVNLKRATRHGLESLGGGLWCGAWRDAYAPERMLLPELFVDLAIDGAPVVFLPGAEHIFVAGSNDADALRRALELVDERFAAPRGLLDFGFVLEGGAWKPYLPGEILGRELAARISRHLPRRRLPMRAVAVAFVLCVVLGTLMLLARR